MKNKPLFAKIIKHIRAEPEALDMSRYVRSAQGCEGACGTVGCIAGWAVILAEPVMEPLLLSAFNVLRCETDYQSDRYLKASGLLDSVPDRARLWLEISAHQCHVLFHVSNWPMKFQLSYEKAKSRGHDPEARQKKLAAITIQRIRHFMKTGR